MSVQVERDPLQTFCMGNQVSKNADYVTSAHNMSITKSVSYTLAVTNNVITNRS